MSVLELQTYDDAFLIKFFVATVRAHPLGQALIKESGPWTQLGERRHYLETVAFDLLRTGSAIESPEWLYTIQHYAIKYQEALVQATAYASREDAAILDDYLNYRVPYYLWHPLTSKMNLNRLNALMLRAQRVRDADQARADAEERAEAYSDF
jgi:hypothetical protein